MVHTCVYCGEKFRVGNGRTFHSFPLKQPEILRSWLNNIQLGENFQPTNGMKLCSDHFEKECLKKPGVNVTLAENSIPTLFGIPKSACVYCRAIKKPGDPRTFHSFPHKNAQLLEKWIVNLGTKNCILGPRSLLCSDHFEKSCFRPSGHSHGQQLRLRNTAVPTIFVPTTTSQVTERLGPVIAKRTGSLEELPAVKRLHAESDSTVISSPLNQTPKWPSTPEHSVSSPLNRTPESQATPQHSKVASTPSTRRRVQLTQHDHHYEDTPRTVRKKLSATNQRLRKMKGERRVYKQKIKRLQKKVRSLKDIVSELRKARAISEAGLACLDSIADEDISQFLKRYMKNKKNVGKETPAAKKKQWKNSKNSGGLGISRQRYPPALRSFAMTLHFYSPKAYGFVRRKFCNALPEPSTLRSWYSTINGDPGFTSESFDALKLKVSEAESEGKEVLVSFMLDEISIKKGMQYLSNGTVRGYVDLGSGIDTCGTVPLAKDALVMMAVSLDSSWKIPLGYFLISGIDSETNSGLVREGLTRLHEIGVKVVSVTLDGPSEHFATMRLLGASFDMPNPKPFFPHPSTGHKVNVIFDACHMLKLVRNCLGEFKVLKDGEGNLIEWKFIVALADLQKEEGLRAGNKIRTAHVQYWKMKMKVALAAQTLSSSVADAIQFCTDLGLKKFQGSEGTVRFIRCIDRLFDFLNSRNPFAKGFKAPLRKSNEVFWRQTVEAELEYLKKITDVQGKPLSSTKRYVPIVGLVTGVMAVISIFDAYVKPDGSQLKYLLTYKLSQDHLELFFCAIRSCGGWCPNPTCTQFVSAYKRLLVRHEVTAVNGNVESMDATAILTASSGTPKKKKVDLYDAAVYDNIANIRVSKKYGLDEEDEQLSNADDFLTEFLVFRSRLPTALSVFSNNCVAYIAGWVVKKLVNEKKPIVKCERCRLALLQDSLVMEEFRESCALIRAKTRGGLIYPSRSVIKICQYAEKLLRTALNVNNGMTPSEPNFAAVLCSKVMVDLLQAPDSLFTSLNDHVFDDAVEELSNHIYFLTKETCKAYIKLRLFAATKIASEKAVGTKVRHHMTRQIIWQNQ